MTNRQEALLASVAERYIAAAEPVSSKFLEKRGFFGLKSATIRSEMNELETDGYLTHPYTSGGRIPTDKGYRYFVDNLIGVKLSFTPLGLRTGKRKAQNEKDRKEIKSAIAASGYSPHQINKSVAQILSELSDNLVITNIMEEDDFCKVGLASLFEMPDFREFDKMFRLTSFFDEFEDMFSQLIKRMDADAAETDGLRIFIGRENPVRDIRDETAMFAKYDLPQGYTGSLTLIGPTRMDYEKNIGLIKYTTRELNKLAQKI